MRCHAGCIRTLVDIPDLFLTVNQGHSAPVPACLLVRTDRFETFPGPSLWGLQIRLTNLLRTHCQLLSRTFRVEPALSLVGLYPRRRPGHCIFKKEPTGERLIRLTMPRLMTSSVNSINPHWLTGRPRWLGSSRATRQRPTVQNLTVVMGRKFTRITRPFSIT